MDRVPPVHHETTDANVGAVLGFGAALVAVGVLVSLLVGLLLAYFNANAREARRQQAEYPLAVAHENRLPPEPRLQANPRQDLRNLRAQEDQILDTFGWVDKRAGIVRIPIQEAMKLAVERGLPAREAR